MTELTGKQKRHLRSLGHHLEPALMIGANGVVEGPIAELDRSLAVHELVKVRVGQGCGQERKDVAAALATATDSSVAQIVGRTILFYRPAKKRKIQLP
ncbi:MAG TPA: ribosome assembly RNA-binding protein YhbY [Deferrisomatales bacterium]|nr:ribosome assembly RNA-binding protein YhbY [Deferrisomatales bacterium]